MNERIIFTVARCKTNEWMNEWTNKQMNERMKNKWMKEQIGDGCMLSEWKMNEWKRKLGMNEWVDEWSTNKEHVYFL